MSSVLTVPELRLAIPASRNNMNTPIIRLSPTPHTNMTPAQALSSALADAKKGMQDVLIIAYDEYGELYIRSSKMNCAEAFFMAHQAMKWAEAPGEM